jgi:hypothetical protein
MRATLMIPIAVLAVAGAVGTVGVTIGSVSEDAPLTPIVVRAPEEGSPVPGSMPPLAPAPRLPATAEHYPPAMLMDPEGVPAPPPAITRNVAPPPAVTRSEPAPPPAITRTVPAPPPVFGGDDDADDWGDDDFDGDD